MRSGLGQALNLVPELPDSSQFLLRHANLFKGQKGLLLETPDADSLGLLAMDRPRQDTGATDRMARLAPNDTGSPAQNSAKVKIGTAYAYRQDSEFFFFFLQKKN